VAAQPTVDQLKAFPADARRAFDDTGIERGDFLGGKAGFVQQKPQGVALPRRKDESRGCRSAGARRSAIGYFGQGARIRETGRTKKFGRKAAKSAYYAKARLRIPPQTANEKILISIFAVCISITADVLRDLRREPAFDFYIEIKNKSFTALTVMDR
jgi:hypothetical protein